jgi:hypothetical protein
MANSKGGTHFNNDSGAEFAEPKTSVIHSGSADYLLGNSIQEQERLKLQAKFLQQWSEQFLLSAGTSLPCDREQPLLTLGWRNDISEGDTGYAGKLLCILIRAQNFDSRKWASV